MNDTICAVCGNTEDIITDCQYYARGFGAVCPACCEDCHTTTPFPCREHDRRTADNKITEV